MRLKLALAPQLIIIIVVTINITAAATARGTGWPKQTMKAQVAVIKEATGVTIPVLIVAEHQVPVSNPPPSSSRQLRWHAEVPTRESRQQVVPRNGLELAEETEFARPAHKLALLHAVDKRLGSNKLA